MKKYILTGVFAFCVCIASFAQGEMDALLNSRQEIKGTARYMGMGGAFGALGGDITTLSQNPAGIGVYRSSEIAATLNLGTVNTEVSTFSGASQKENMFRAAFDNIGYVATFATGMSNYLKNFNVGFAYNRQKSFNRTFRAQYNDLQSSMTNYIAAKTNGTPLKQLASDPDNKYDPYYTNTYVPWIGILGYESWLIDPENDTDDNRNYDGFFIPGEDRANGDLYMQERGRMDEYSFNLGGNISDVVYLGIGLGVIDLNYEMSSSYREYINWNAYDEHQRPIPQQGEYDFTNVLRSSGSGVNFKMGIILRPTNYWRLGFAFHTPTFLDITDRYQATVHVQNIGESAYDEGTGQYNPDLVRVISTPSDRSSYKLRTPWKFMASTAFVIGKQGIISFDYEYTGYNQMHLSNDIEDDFADNQYIKEDMRAGHTFKIGGEYKPIPALSLRAGFAAQLSPIKAKLLDEPVTVMMAGTRTTYYLDRGSQYYTCGLGYRFGNIFIDGAFVYQHNKADLYAFAPIFEEGTQTVFPEKAKLSTAKPQFLLTLGYKF